LMWSTHHPVKRKIKKPSAGGAGTYEGKTDRVELNPYPFVIANASRSTPAAKKPVNLSQFAHS